MKTRTLLAVLGAAVLLAGCATHELPPPISTSKSADALDRWNPADRNHDGYVSHDEWVAAGGYEGRIRPGDDGSGLPPFPERLTRLMNRVADLSDEPMTPVEFRSPAGARVATVDF